MPLVSVQPVVLGVGYNDHASFPADFLGNLLRDLPKAFVVGEKTTFDIDYVGAELTEG